jgi:hypothetical protein
VVALLLVCRIGLFTPHEAFVESLPGDPKHASSQTLITFRPPQSLGDERLLGLTQRE